MSEKTIYLVFKTHLDIGFTDHAANIRRLYHDRFIPQAIDTGTHFYNENPKAPAFVWTTGAWLVWDHLATQPKAKVKRLEQAIERGLIRWHALPFTTHTELMSPDLFRAGLSYSHELDKRFGKKTIAAKMTDVPGHPRGIVPLLAEAGVKFLHLGVNAASPVPDVPDVFRWRAPNGEEILVMYQSSYGATHFPKGFNEGLSFAHTNDNMGPQSAHQTVDAYSHIRRDNPGAIIKPAILDDYAEILWPRRAEFPVFEQEVGDSWIHGAASDPQKLRRYLALQRLYDGFAAEGKLSHKRLAFGRNLAMVAEHTWGVDIKSFLRDDTAWDRLSFEAMRKSDYRFAFTEASWDEQRAYIGEAVAELDSDDRKLAKRALRALDTPPEPEPKSRPKTPPGGASMVGGWAVTVNPVTGDIVALIAPDGRTLSGLNGVLLGYRHESYDSADMDRYRRSYITNAFEWALLDFGKPGLSSANTARSMRWLPALSGVIPSKDSLSIGLQLPDAARNELGAPASAELRVRPLDDDRVEVSLVLRDKPANRMPEAGFLLMTPQGASGWEFLKMGLWQPGDGIAAKGGGQLQSIFGARAHLDSGATLAIDPLDAPLVAPAAGDFMTYLAAPPDYAEGLRFNLYNNKWATNFAMWWEGDLVARYVLTLK